MMDCFDVDYVLLEMICGKGGYVWFIVCDLGEVLGCYGYVYWLCCIWLGFFEVQDGLSIE